MLLVDVMVSTDDITEIKKTSLVSTPVFAYVFGSQIGSSIEPETLDGDPGTQADTMLERTVSSIPVESSTPWRSAVLAGGRR